jgi:hypothetical protein
VYFVVVVPQYNNVKFTPFGCDVVGKDAVVKSVVEHAKQIAELLDDELDELDLLDELELLDDELDELDLLDELELLDDELDLLDELELFDDELDLLDELDTEVLELLDDELDIAALDEPVL